MTVPDADEERIYAEFFEAETKWKEADKEVRDAWTAYNVAKPQEHLLLVEPLARLDVWISAARAAKKAYTLAKLRYDALR